MSVIGFSLVPNNAKASGTFVEQEAVAGGVGSLKIPQIIALIGQYNSGKSPTVNTPRLLASADEAAQLYGPGSQLHLMARKAFAGAGAVPIYAIPVADAGGATAATGSITITGTATSGGTIAIFVAGQKITVPVTLGDSASTIAANIANAISAAVNLPLSATPSANVVNVTSKWAGDSANGITIKLDLDAGDSLKEPTGVSLAISQPSGGATDPTLTTALASFGTTFFTQVAFPYTSAAALSALDAAWTSRLDPQVKKPILAMLGDVSLYADFVSALAARNSPVETYVNAESSPNLPCEIAASAVGVCARSAESNPARPWKTLTLPGIRAGTLPAWSWAQHNTAQDAGGGTTEPNLDGTVKIKDLVTSYKTNALGAADDSFRYPETIANLQAKIYSLDTLFSLPPFDRGIVVDDASVTGLDYAVRPRTVKAFVRRLIDELWIPEAWSKERDEIMASIVTEIDSGNAGRINVQFEDRMSAGLRIIAIKYRWSFGAAA